VPVFDDIDEIPISIDTKMKKHDHIFGHSKHFMYLCRKIETKNNE
jgi:hypothetical protein